MFFCRNQKKETKKQTNKQTNKQTKKKIESNLREISYENNSNQNFYKFINKIVFVIFLSFRKNQKQESNFQEVGWLLTNCV